MGKTKHRGLVTRYDGLFKIMEKVGVVAYPLKLSEQLKFHPTFHVSYLRPFHKNKRIQKEVSCKELF